MKVKKIVLLGFYNPKVIKQNCKVCDPGCKGYGL